MKSVKVNPKIAELQDRLTRSLADYINLEKRIERDKDLLATLITTSITTQMIDVLDTFVLAQNHLKDTGLQMAIDKFKAVLNNNGLTEINPLNLPFNPDTMECVEVADGKPDIVIAVRRSGYSINNQTIRPAQVVVGKIKN